MTRPVPSPCARPERHGAAALRILVPPAPAPEGPPHARHPLPRRRRRPALRRLRGRAAAGAAARLGALPRDLAGPRLSRAAHRRAHRAPGGPARPRQLREAPRPRGVHAGGLRAGPARRARRGGDRPRGADGLLARRTHRAEHDAGASWPGHAPGEPRRLGLRAAGRGGLGVLPGRDRRGPRAGHGVVLRRSGAGAGGRLAPCARHAHRLPRRGPRGGRGAARRDRRHRRRAGRDAGELHGSRAVDGRQRGPSPPR